MNRIQRMLERRIDESVLTAKKANEVYRQLQQGDAVKYAIGAMQPIDPEYTSNTFREGNRVRDQLAKRLTEPCDYEYQGSTTNDTHIRARSDIDLLAIISSWSWVAEGVPTDSPYSGDPLRAVRNHRRDSEQAVQNGFPQAVTDTSGKTSIKVEGGSLNRRVDVVPATWYDTMDYYRTKVKVYRGVRVFNKVTEEFTLNQPFLHNLRIVEKDTLTLGGMRKAARLMKSLKYDTVAIEMSSYNIVSIAWNMPDELLAHSVPNELRIVYSCREYCGRLRNDSTLRSIVRVPDDSRQVFGSSPGASLVELDQLIAELDRLIREIESDLRRSFARLEDARIEYITR